MTLQEFFNYLSDNPYYLVFYFGLIPVFAFALNKFSGNKATSSPYTEIYSTLIFLVAIPAVLAFALTIYLLLFERRSILLLNVYTQVLPIISFILTLLIIKRHLSLSVIPGFGKVAGLIMMTFAGLAIMWLLDRTRIFFIAFTHMPFQYVLLIFILIIVVIRIGWRRFFR